MDNSLKEVISKHVFLGGLNKEYINVISSLAQVKHVSDACFIAREGDSADEFYLIRSGGVSITTPAGEGPQLEVQSLGVGELIGWSWIIPPYSWTFDAIAVGDVELIAIDGRELRAQCDMNPRLGYELMKLLSRVMSMRLLQIKTKAVDLNFELRHASNRSTLEANRSVPKDVDSREPVILDINKGVASNLADF